MSAPSSPAAPRSLSREQSPSPSSEAPEIKAPGSEVCDEGVETKMSPGELHVIKATEYHTKLEHSRSPSPLLKNDAPDSTAAVAFTKEDTDAEPSGVSSAPIKDDAPESLEDIAAVKEDFDSGDVAVSSTPVEDDDPGHPLRGAATTSDNGLPLSDVLPAHANHTPPDPYGYLFDDDGGSDDDDNWQPQSHGPDVPQRSTKRKSRATAYDNDGSGDEGSVDLIPGTNVTRSKKKLKVVEDPPTEIDEEAPVVPRNAKPSGPSKRKRRTKQDDDQNDGDADEDTPAKKSRRPPPKDEYERLVRIEEDRLAKALNPKLTKLNRDVTMKVKKGSAQIVDRIDYLKELAKQIEDAPASRHPDFISGDLDKDDNDRKTKFYYDRIRQQPVKEREIGGWKGSKWVDEEDENVTWFKIPAKQKYLSLSGRMVPVADIVAASPLLPEFRFVENVFTEDPKSGKKVVGFHVVTYERMPLEEKNERMKALVAREKMRKKQEAKDAAAAKRRGKGRGRT